jgi:hypothetical protein
MARPNAATDFAIEVHGVGNFMFAKRGMRDELRIQAEISRLTEGVENPTAFLDLISTWLAVLGVLTVSAPEGWDLMAMDPLDPLVYNNLGKVFKALRDKESSFRPGAPATGQDGGTGAGDIGGVLVPKQA